MKRLVPIMAGLLALFACNDGNGVSIEDAVVTLPAVPGRPGAAYFTIRIDRPTRLTAISSPNVGRVELHESTMVGGMSRMAPLANPALSPDTPMVFAPGGRHAMLYDIVPTVRAGQQLSLTFTFETVSPITIEAAVRGPGEADVHH